MTFIKFQLDRKGGSEVLKDMAKPTISGLGHKVVANAGEGAYLHESTTDRAVASVSVPAARQAAHGALTKAASEAGLEVKPK